MNKVDKDFIDASDVAKRYKKVQKRVRSAYLNIACNINDKNIDKLGQLMDWMCEQKNCDWWLLFTANDVGKYLKSELGWKRSPFKHLATIVGKYNERKRNCKI